MTRGLLAYIMCLTNFYPNYWPTSFELFSQKLSLLFRVPLCLKGTFTITSLLLMKSCLCFFFLNRTKVGYKTIKLDMKKAYVKLDWNFISKCFQDLGFSYKWINWNMQCTTTISFRVMDSKIDAPFFFPERGQGDPFSLYVFIICTEYLGWLINYLANQKKSGIGIKISKDSISFRV